MIRGAHVRAIAVIIVAALASTATAHQDPPGCSGVNISQSLLVTPSAGPILPCTPMSASTVLSWLGECLIGSGSLVIGLADPSDPVNPGADQILASVPVTCLGPATVNNDGCTIGQASSVGAGPVNFAPRPQDIAAGAIRIRARWVGVSHQSAVNLPQSNSREITIPIAPCEHRFCSTAACVPGQNPGQAGCVYTDVSATVCPDALFCTDVLCDEASDQCVLADVSATQCPDNLFCAAVACDEATDSCVTSDVSGLQCIDLLFCTDRVCNETTDSCDSFDVSSTVCPDAAFCSDTVCDERFDACVTFDVSATQCPDPYFCAATFCDETSDQCGVIDVSAALCLTGCCNESIDQCEVSCGATPPNDDALGTVAAGGTVTTDPEADGTNATDVVETRVTTPTGGLVSIFETSSFAPVPGYRVLGQAIIVAAPPASAAAPLILEFTVDGSVVPPGTGLVSVGVLRNRVPVAVCASGAGSADPDPCLVDRTLLGDGSIALRVLTSAASEWLVVVRERQQIAIGATKLIVVDKQAAQGAAKTVFVAKDAAVTKGAGTDPTAISATLVVRLADDSAAGSFDVPAGADDDVGWRVNGETVAKYGSTLAPNGPTQVKLAVVKPGTLLKLVAKGVGDTPLDLFAATVGAEVRTAYCVANGDDEICHCSAFPACSLREVAGGDGRKLVCKAGAPEPSCAALGG